MTRMVLFSLLCLLACLYSATKGGLPERFAGLLILLAYLMSVVLQDSDHLRFQNVDGGLLLVDSVLLFALIYLAIISQRFWPLWMSAMQVITVFSHFPIAIKEGILPWAYWRAISMWSYPMLFLLVAGTWWHQKRLKQSGRDDPWKPSLHL
jgi:hypothetical protein